MEHSTSAVNWQPINYAKAPGQLGRNSLAHLARGADGIAFFQWRASLGGAEKFHSGAGPARRHRHQGLARGRRARRPAVAGCPSCRGTAVTARVAVVFDWQAQWASELGGHPTVLFDYDREGQEWYAALWDAGITVDVVPPDADLSSYAVVVVPSLYSCTDCRGREHRGGRARRRAGRHHLLQRDRRRATSRCGRVATPAPSASSSVSAPRSSSRCGPDETVRLDDGTTATRLDRAHSPRRARPSWRRTSTGRWRAVRR